MHVAIVYGSTNVELMGYPRLTIANISWVQGIEVISGRDG